MCQSLPQNCLPSTFFLSKIFPAVVTAAACRQGVIDGVGEGGETLPPPPQKIVPQKCVSTNILEVNAVAAGREGVLEMGFFPLKNKRRGLKRHTTIIIIIVP